MDREERDALDMTKEQLLSAAGKGMAADVHRPVPGDPDRPPVVREMNPGKKRGQSPRPVPTSQRENTRYRSVTGV
jgi:hypothetical protein